MRLHELDLDPLELDWAEFALRYAVYAPGVHSAITGTAKLTHLLRNVEAAGCGPRPAAALSSIDRSGLRVGSDWPGLT